MIVDAHTHIFPAELISARETLLRDEPLFAELYRSPRARMATAADLLAAMAEAGVDHAIIAGIAWRDPDRCRLHNDALLAAAATSAGRLSAFCTVPLTTPDEALREIERCASGGACGLGELRLDLFGEAHDWRYGVGTPETWGQAPGGAHHHDSAVPEKAPAARSNQNQRAGATAYEDRRAAVLAEAAVALGLPVLLHASEPVGHTYPGKGGGALGGVWAFLSAFPTVTVMLAHLGGGLPFYAQMPEVQAVFARAYVDTAAVPWLYRPSAYRAVIDLIGAGRVLFGSDFPLRHPARDLALLRAAGLTPDELMAIAGGNAAALLGLERNPDPSGSRRDKAARL